MNSLVAPTASPGTHAKRRLEREAARKMVAAGSGGVVAQRGGLVSHPLRGGRDELSIPELAMTAAVDPVR